MGNAYRTNLIQRVLDESESNTWNEAVLEWVIDDCEEDNSLQSSCICGKEELRYLFTIRNVRMVILFFLLVVLALKSLIETI